MESRGRHVRDGLRVSTFRLGLSPHHLQQHLPVGNQPGIPSRNPDIVPGGCSHQEVMKDSISYNCNKLRTLFILYSNKEKQSNNSLKVITTFFISYFDLFSLLTSAEKRVSSLAEITKLSWLSNIDWNNLRERPAAIPVHITSIDDTSYFDTFPDVQLDIRT